MLVNNEDNKPIIAQSRQKFYRGKQKDKLKLFRKKEIINRALSNKQFKIIIENKKKTDNNKSSKYRHLLDIY